jgi:peptidylprolyl isomerase
MFVRMRARLLLALVLVLCGVPAADSEGALAAPDRRTPAEIVAGAAAGDWIDIRPEDLLVMTLAPDAKGRPRTVILQLAPAPVSAGWVANIRRLAAARWWDGASVYRVQDNYVAQWGHAEGAEPARARALPDGLVAVPEADYVTRVAIAAREAATRRLTSRTSRVDPYAGRSFFLDGWPMASDNLSDSPVVDAQTGRPPAARTHEGAWPVHCYGAVGVARGMPPDTGSGTDLYVVIGHAPRQLDRNIALVGRVIEGIEHLAGLPRGPAPMGVHDDAGARTPIASVRLASDLPAAERPRLQFLATETEVFGRYADARANRRDPFYLVPAGGADICNIPVPIRRRP